MNIILAYHAYLHYLMTFFYLLLNFCISTTNEEINHK